MCVLYIFLMCFALFSTPEKSALSKIGKFLNKTQFDSWTVFLGGKKNCVTFLTLSKRRQHAK